MTTPEFKIPNAIEQKFDHCSSSYILSAKLYKSCLSEELFFRALLLFVLIMSVLLPTCLMAEESNQRGLFHRETLLGDWAGHRQKLSDKGVDFEFTYTGDVIANVSGGIQKHGEYLDNLDMILSVDAEKLYNWKGASFYFYGVANQGGSPSGNSGDVQGPSNIESDDAWKLHEAWYQQKLFDDKFSVLLGLYDLNSEFDSIETAGLFINSSHGMGPDFSQSGLNGPSAFPNTSLAMRLNYTPVKPFYIQFAVLDGVAGDPAHPHSTRIKFGKQDGLLLATEVGYLPGERNDDAAYGKFSVGSWYYTSGFDDITDVDLLANPVRRSGDFGIYAFGEYNIYREKQDHEQGLSVFGRVGYANPKINQFEYYIGIGLSYTGLIPGRDEDQVGLAVATAINGSHYLAGQKTAGTPAKRIESNVELTYRAQLAPWLAIQPDVQLIINPGMDPATSHALQAGARFQVSF